MPYRTRGYQYAGSRFLSLSSAILGFRVGLGKTWTTLLAVEEANTTKNLVIAPKTLKAWWVKEIKNFYGEAQATVEDLGHHLWKVTVTRQNKPMREFFLAHYEHFNDRSKLLTRFKITAWDAVICDEVHRIKNRRAQRTQNIKQLLSKYRWGLTGTPIADKPEDLWSLLNWVAPKVWTSYWTFVKTYCEMVYNPYSKTRQPEGFKRDKTGSTDATLQLLQYQAAPYLLVKSLEDVGIELPPVVHTTIPLEMADTQRRFYNKVQKDIVIEVTAELERSSVALTFLDLSDDSNYLIIRSAGARFVRLQQVASAPTVFTEVDNAKLDWLRDYLEDGGAPALILTRFNHTVEKIQALLTEVGATGFIVGTWAKLSEGHNFQHLGTLIAWDLPMYLLEWTQGLGRVDRPGQTANKVHVIRLCCTDTVDEDLIDLIEGKQDTAEMLIRWLRGVMGGKNELHKENS